MGAVSKPLVQFQHPQSCTYIIHRRAVSQGFQLGCVDTEFSCVGWGGKRSQTGLCQLLCSQSSL